MNTHLSIEKENILTLDIECLIINKEFIPYAVGLYNGNIFKYSYGMDCIKDIIDQLTSHISSNIVIYVHNLDRFDSKF